MTRTLEATERKQVRMPDIDKVVVITGASSVELRTRETTI
jgi:hypothetical protein